jgi:hypothetical protein
MTHVCSRCRIAKSMDSRGASWCPQCGVWSTESRDAGIGRWSNPLVFRCLVVGIVAYVVTGVVWSLFAAYDGLGPILGLTERVGYPVFVSLTAAFSIALFSARAAILLGLRDLWMAIPLLVLMLACLALDLAGLAVQFVYVQGLMDGERDSAVASLNAFIDTTDIGLSSVARLVFLGYASFLLVSVAGKAMLALAIPTVVLLILSVLLQVSSLWTKSKLWEGPAYPIALWAMSFLSFAGTSAVLILLALAVERLRRSIANP